jgi:GTP:adenosylcobinamide-phosphate guanylyltransferase
MKFIVSRTTVSLRKSRKPCDEATEADLTPLDYRTVKTLDDAKKKVWYKDWLEGGLNHREEAGMVVCDSKIKEKQWVVDIDSLEDLIAFQEKYGEILISDSAPYKEAKKEIKILATNEKP